MSAPEGPAPAAPPILDDEEGRGWLGIAAYVLFVAVGALWVFWFAASLGPATEAQAEAPCRALEPVPRSGPAPDFTVQDLAGNKVGLQDLRGKFVVVNFWATWCEPCIREWPQLDRLAERLATAGRDDVAILAISVDEDRTKVAPFLERMGLAETGVRVLWDPTAKLHNAYGSEKLPDTYFVSRDGQLIHAFINVRDWGRPAAYRCVESMLAR